MKQILTLLLTFNLIYLPLFEIKSQVTPLPSVTPTISPTVGVVPTVSGTAVTTSTGDNKDVIRPYPVIALENPEGKTFLLTTYITALLFAFFGVMIPAMCFKIMTKKPSIIAYTLASVIYLGGEVYTTFRFKNLATPEKIINLSKQEEVDKQIAYYQELLKLHQEYRTVMTHKYYLAIAASVAYGLAAIVAIGEAIMDYMNPDKILYCQPIKLTHTQQPPIEQNSSILSLLSKQLGLISEAYAEVAPTLNITPTAVSIGTPSATATPTDQIASGSTYKIIKYVLLGMGGAFGGMVATIFHYSALTTQSFFVKLISSPFTRIVLFGVSAGVVALLAVAIKKQRETLDERIAYLEELIRTLQKENPAAKEYDVGDNMTPYIPGVPVSPEIKPQLPSEQTDPCLAPSQTTVGLDEQCRCKQSGSGCGSSLKYTPSSSNIAPAPIPAVAGNLNDIQSSLGSGNAAPAIASAQNAGRQAAALKKLYDKSLKKLNDKLGESKKPQIDAQKEGEKLFDKMQAAVLEKAKEQGLSEDQLRSAGGSLLGGGLSGGGSTATSPTSLNPLTSGSPSASSGNSGQNGGGGPANRSLQLGNMAGGEALPPVEENLGNINGSGDSLENYQENYHDIHEANGPSIFEILSHRYFVSGHPRLLEKKGN